MLTSNIRRHFNWLLIVVACAVRSTAAAPAYDPLAVPAGFTATTLDLSVHDAKRQRDLPIRLYLPASKDTAPVVLFSHGLGGSRDNDAFLGKHWAARGYVGVFLQHPGSDTSVWQDKPAGQRMAAMRQAAGLQNFRLRVEDVPVVLNQLERWNAEANHPLWHRLDLKRVGMSGHSFGAVTTQAVSGQSFPVVGTAFTDPRIKAACMFSPSGTRRAGGPGPSFDAVKIPWLLMTGTKDVSPIGDIDLASRLAVYPALPPGGKYEVVLEGAEHSAFGDRALPGDVEGRNPNHHKVMMALTTAFWDAWLREDPAAKAWLDGAGAPSVLQKGDTWKKK